MNAHDNFQFIYNNCSVRFAARQSEKNKKTKTKQNKTKQKQKQKYNLHGFLIMFLFMHDFQVFLKRRPRVSVSATPYNVLWRSTEYLPITIHLEQTGLCPFRRICPVRSAIFELHDKRLFKSVEKNVLSFKTVRSHIRSNWLKYKTKIRKTPLWTHTPYLYTFSNSSKSKLSAFLFSIVQRLVLYFNSSSDDARCHPLTSGESGFIWEILTDVLLMM